MFDLGRIEDTAMRFPRLWDRLVGAFPGFANREVFKLFDRFSRESDGPIRFVQIGASDGMRCDPIREFVVRDAWQGIFVEPVPEAFRMLRENYAYLANDGLQFVNAAISDVADPLEFWTFSDAFLSGLPIRERMSFLRKSSFDRDHVDGYVAQDRLPEDVLAKIDVAVMTLGELVRTYSPGVAIDLLVIDAEGHEARILQASELRELRPRMIFFESHNLREEGGELAAQLEGLGYRLEAFGGDTAATLDQAHG